MAPTNGAPRDGEVGPSPRPPFPRRPPEPTPEIVQAGIKGQPMPADAMQRHGGGIQAPAEPVHDFMGRIERAAEMLANVGNELGHAGEDDAQALRSFANNLQQTVQKYISQLVARKRAELSDLERLLGKF